METCLIKKSSRIRLPDCLEKRGKEIRRVSCSRLRLFCKELLSADLIRLFLLFLSFCFKNLTPDISIVQACGDDPINLNGDSLIQLNEALEFNRRKVRFCLEQLTKRLRMFKAQGVGNFAYILMNLLLSVFLIAQMSTERDP
ncbi:MAG: hypothetical protein JWM14_3354 [Chitinophagaceae bacterium]|nr:hypothetical protein [Chitinophagaceae bacterium]